MWLRAGLLTALTAAGLASAAPAAWGQPYVCGERELVLEQLERKYRELRTAYGVNSRGRLVELFVSPAGSWTIVVTTPNGRSCLVTSGEGWRQIIEPPDKPLA